MKIAGARPHQKRVSRAHLTQGIGLGVKKNYSIFVVDEEILGIAWDKNTDNATGGNTCALDQRDLCINIYRTMISAGDGELNCLFTSISFMINE